MNTNKVVEFTASFDDAVRDDELVLVATFRNFTNWIDLDNGYMFNNGRKELYWLARLWFRERMREEGVKRYKVREQKFLSESRKRLEWVSDKRYTQDPKARVMRGFKLTPKGFGMVGDFVRFVEWARVQDRKTPNFLWDIWRADSAQEIVDEFCSTGTFDPKAYLDGR